IKMKRVLRLACFMTDARRTRGLVIAGSTALLLTMSGAARAHHKSQPQPIFCRNSSGQVFLRSACKKGEVQVDLSQQPGRKDPSGTQGPPGGQNPHGAQEVAGPAAPEGPEGPT